jgi:hypothetical protein
LISRTVWNKYTDSETRRRELGGSGSQLLLAVRDVVARGRKGRFDSERSPSAKCATWACAASLS